MIHLFLLQVIYGLDINPRAIKVAWINLYLNSLDENGFPIFDDEGKNLLERVEFHESDLLSYCIEYNIMVDHIVAYIPHILNPNPEAMSKLVIENANEEFLYSLSSYCALQSLFEKWSPHKAYDLDIDPKDVKFAWKRVKR